MSLQLVGVSQSRAMNVTDSQPRIQLLKINARINVYMWIRLASSYRCIYMLMAEWNNF